MARRWMSRRPERGSRAGAVLVLVLILLGLVAALVTQVLTGARATLRVEESQLRGARLRAVLAGAARVAMQQLADDETLSVDHADEPWAASYEVKDPAGVSVWMRVTDENRRFDLNNLHLETGSAPGRPAADIVMDILTLCGDFAPVDRVQALRDWIDSDDEGFRESVYYQEQEPPYVCPNRWVAAWSELPYVAGFTRAYLEPRARVTNRQDFEGSLPDCVTVLGGRRREPVRVNINTAPREVLLAVLGMEQEGLVQYIMAARQERPLLALEQVAAVADPLVMENARPYLDVKSGFFLLEARAFEQGQAAGLLALLKRDGQGAVRVLRWIN